MENFQGRTVLITGATRGLGTHLVEHFAHSGANLVLVARDAEKLAAIRNTQSIEVIPTDLSSPQEVFNLTQQIKHIDILINNAATQGPIGPVWENDWEKWQAALHVDLIAPIALCRAVLPYMMQKNYGKIINLSGGGATQARPNFSAYAVAKAGLVRFTETLAQEVKEFHINVNCIAPGVMHTDMLQEVLDFTGEDLANIKTDDPNRAAELCLFLASKKSDDITGKLISAVWDPWKDLANHIDDIKNSDIYTLRRIMPKDRGKAWGEI